ncbi:hypothetical protein LVD17_24370 [Fulvivirga ulvae]|uniref:hypothetical protein n=1 Tax=Fulvivirga ulvae TaxID=2904245 RepID=UPI001F3FB1A3|nr:hypothetical protein [Fulvivirga ulvae]UII31432.1 hypothetical protein LVD17_24370 [Fulvivirga ulvae]
MKKPKKPEFEPSEPPEIIPDPDFPEKIPPEDPEEEPDEPATRPSKEPNTPFPDKKERPSRK